MPHRSLLVSLKFARRQGGDMAITIPFKEGSLMKRHLPVPRRSERPRQLRRPISALLMACAGMLLAACGGGSGGGPGGGTATINGSVFASHVTGSSVTVKDADGFVVADNVATAADGAFSIVVPAGATSGALRLEAVGGTFTDEATGASTVAGRLAAYVEAGALGTGAAVHLTPASTILHDLRVSGRTRPQADDLMTTAFGFTDNSAISPKNDNTVAGADNVARRLAALRAVAFSQMTKDLGLPADNQFDLVKAIAQDLSDNVLNGRDGANVVLVAGSPLAEDIQNRFECAFDKVFDNASMNHTGLTADKVGTLPFSKMALTNSYRVEYIPGMMPAVQGKTQFKVKVTSLSDNTAVTGLAASGSLNLFPWMHMATKSHSSPFDAAAVDNGDGTYTCTVYYLMSTAMGGNSMGYWRLGVDIGAPGAAETATFFPTVGMAMGTDTVRAQLKGQQDNIVAGLASEQRTYTLFKDGEMTYDNTSATHALNVFVSAKESMTSFPAVGVGTVLHDTSGAAWTVDAMSVDASTDNVVWLRGTNSAGGHWSVAGLTGLSRGAAGKVSVRVIVNGEQKTTNGGAPAGTNAYAAFDVTAP